jgi:hypothetical protein
MGLVTGNQSLNLFEPARQLMYPDVFRLSDTTLGVFSWGSYIQQQGILFLHQVNGKFGCALDRTTGSRCARLTTIPVQTDQYQQCQTQPIRSSSVTAVSQHLEILDLCPGLQSQAVQSR